MAKFGVTDPDSWEDSTAEQFRNLIIYSTDCRVLQRLEQLRKISFSDRTQPFGQGTGPAMPSTTQDAKCWLVLFNNIIKEMDEGLQFVPALGPLTFLDVGCAPGGYSQYILFKNPQSEGTGITLPKLVGGVKLCIPKNLTKGARYRIHFANIAHYDLCSPFSAKNPQDWRTRAIPNPLPFSHSSFGLVILDGDVDLYDPGFSRVILFTQLIVGLQSVTSGGTILIKLKNGADPLTARLVFLLDSVTEGGGRLDLVKPRSALADQDIFYAIARGIQKGELLDQFVQSLCRVLLVEKRCCIATPSARQNLQQLVPPKGLFQQATEDVLDTIVPLLTLEMTYIPRLAELLRPVWEVQVDGLLKLLRGRGVDI